MKSIDELDHYDLLEIRPTANQAEIERAYATAQQVYAEGSLALYSVFDGIDGAAIRARLDEAYRVLTDPEAREAYDREGHFEAAPKPDESPAPSAPATSPPIVDAPTSSEEQRSFEELAGEFDPLEEEPGADFDGSRLRRTRLFRGYEIEQISDVTKVSGSHLRNIEEENFADLPADVYVRGFVTAYAKTIGLDPELVVPSYMARVAESRNAGPRGRFLGRR